MVVSWYMVGSAELQQVISTENGWLAPSDKHAWARGGLCLTLKGHTSYK